MNHGTNQIAKALRIVVLMGVLFALAAPATTLAGRPASESPATASAAGAAPGAIRAQQVATNTIFLRVTSARTEPRANGGAGVNKGDPVTQYKWLISVDNTGNPDPSLPACQPFLDPPANTQPNPDYPDKCEWPGIRTVPGWAPVYTQGTEAELNQATGITLPDGKYLISVMADGYKMDGEHFTLPLAGSGLIEVQAQPQPLPTASMAIMVFDDSAMTNGQYDAPVENGLAGFRATISDTMGEITTDMYGNPLCTEYELDTAGQPVLDADGLPTVTVLGAGCYSDDTGMIKIPYLGTIRYDVLVIPPDGTEWLQTTTLEGSQGWDTWLQEGSTGLDNEFVVAGEPFPWTIFGFVQPRTPNLGGTGTLKGTLMGSITASPTKGGLPYQGTTWGGFAGTALHRPITDGWVALNDLQAGDQVVWVGRANPDGTFVIPNIKAGNYFLTYWDEKQHYILDWGQFTVQNGQVTDIGIRTLTYWFTEMYGHVFHDYNGNGKMDPGEPGVPNYPVTLKDRDNTTIDRMSITVLTDPNGYYSLEKAYPMGSWMVLEAYTGNYKTTGVTYQVWNQPTETTLLGEGVDVDVLPILGQPIRVDWGVDTYEPGTNGGIVGTVVYDTMRAEDDARYAGAEPYQPGIPGLTLNLYAATKDPATGHFIMEADGSYKKGPLLNTAVTETFLRPKNCQPRDVDGNPVSFPVFPAYDPTGANGKDCLEGPPMGSQVGNEFATLDGNYGFGDGCFNADGTPGQFDAASQTCATGSLAALPPGDYLVEVEVPNDPVFGKPLFQVTREEDINMYSGDAFYPAVPPPPCAGALHTVDVKGIGADGPAAVDNPGYVDMGGSRFEGQQKPYCDVKLITVGNGKSIAPIFTFFTHVPIPGKWKGYIIDDLNVSTDPTELFFGEMAGVPNVPIGIYDFTGRLVETVHSDRHGVFEVLLPSSATTNAPMPGGLLASVYYIYGNDPGTPGRLNANYNPQYRSIGASFEIYTGVLVPSDLAPVQNGAMIFAPGSQYNQTSQCKLEDFMPQIFAVDKPYGERNQPVTIEGLGFGSAAGPGFNGAVILSNPRIGTYRLNVTTANWTDRRIVATLPRGIQFGQYELAVQAANGYRTVNGVSYHVLGSSYNPRIFEVGPGKTYDPTNPIYNGTGRGPVQHAVDDAIAYGRNALVVVYPGQAVQLTNPLGSYFENVVMYGPVKLQGVGPGGLYPDGSNIPGSILDGRAFGGDTPYTTWWRGTLIPDIWQNKGGWDGSQVDAVGDPRIYEGPVISVLAKDGEFGPETLNAQQTRNLYRAAIDGFMITGGDQQGNPTNINVIGGPIPGVQPNIVIQGGGIFANAYARHMEITNNLIVGNGGAYAGAIRVGTPNVPAPLTDHQNDDIRIQYNRVIANGGTNLAGAIGLFAGAAGYDVSYNDICGNYSAEYGGGISHFGLSPDSSIHHNRILYNRSYDEGGGVMIAGELPADPNILSPGAGAVNVYNNIIQGNLANDDGGGLRFLMAGKARFNVYNNMITNNVSTHEGGGVSIFDATDVRVYNNTIMKNITTATAMTSNGQPAPAGLSTARNSNLLQATLPAGAPVFSNPVLFNNLFWDNRAGSKTPDGIAGIGIQGDPSPIHNWDLGTSDATGTLRPAYTLFQVAEGTEASNVLVSTAPAGVTPGTNPNGWLVTEGYDVQLNILPWRGNPNLVDVEMVGVQAPGKMVGDYHLVAGSPAIGRATMSWLSTFAPITDIDMRNRTRPFDIGADELGR